jgi:hypothetical protein
MLVQSALGIAALFELFGNPAGFENLRGFQKRVRKARRLRNAQILILFSNCARVFVKAVRAMAASRSAAIAAFKVKLFGKNLEAFGRQVIIFAED